MLSPMAARGQSTQVVAEEPQVGADVFPIWPWDTLAATKESYDQARECGFNLAGFVRPENLDLVASAGLKAIVADPSLIAVRGEPNISDADIAARVKQIADRSAGKTATFGYHIIDEPPPSLMPTVARWAKAFEAADPKALAHVNLLPILGGKSPAAREKAYEDYLTAYLDAAKPKAFSFDHYAMMDDGTIRPAFYEGLEVVRRTSLNTSTPFYAVLLACAHFRYADPSPATLRFQAFTALAYGARGIGWFTYVQRDRGNYRESAIDLANHRTPTWDMLRDINFQLQRLAPAIVKLESVNVFHEPDVPLGCRGIESSKFLDDVRGAGPFLVGEFEDADGTPVEIVVNKDIQHSTNFSVVPKSKCTIIRISSQTGQSRPFAAEDNWLPPGGGIVLRLEKAGN